tara:strand:- start:34 stop:618 length:585 start_codon:yes stop_codon:yes gene_type:complete
MSKNFLADMQVGDLGEQLWAAWLNAKGGDCTISTGKCDWDVFDNNTGVYYEVKTDVKAYYWAERRKEPVNLFLEYESVKTQQPCGIMKTNAEYLVYIVRNPERLHIAFTFDLEKLRAYLWKAHKENRFAIRKPVMHGIGNVKGWTPPIHELVDDKDSGFVKLIVLPMFLLNSSNETTLSQLSLLETENRQLVEV